MLFFNTRTNSGEEEIEVYVGHKYGRRTIEENAMAFIALYYSSIRRKMRMTTTTTKDFPDSSVYEEVIRRTVALIEV